MEVATIAAIKTGFDLAKSAAREAVALAKGIKNAEINEKVMALQSYIMDLQDKYFDFKDQYAQEVRALQEEYASLETQNKELRLEIQTLKAKPVTKPGLPEISLRILNVLFERSTCTNYEFFSFLGKERGVIEFHLGELQAARLIGSNLRVVFDYSDPPTEYYITQKGRAAVMDSR